MIVSAGTMLTGRVRLVADFDEGCGEIVGVTLFCDPHDGMPSSAVEFRSSDAVLIGRVIANELGEGDGQP